MHLMRILEITHWDENNNVIWKDDDIPNVFHRQGQQFLLSVAFNSASSITVPTNYYIGMDNRATLSDTDVMSSLSGEPNTNGYARQAVSSANGFTVEVSGGKYRAVSNIVTFSASGGSWGPVRNVFLTNLITNTGYLISSIPLSAARTVTDGQSVTVRVSLSLGN